MYGKIQESGLPEIVTLLCTSAVWGQYPMFSHPEFSQGSPSGVAAVSDDCRRYFISQAAEPETNRLATRNQQFTGTTKVRETSKTTAQGSNQSNPKHEMLYRKNDLVSPTNSKAWGKIRITITEKERKEVKQPMGGPCLDSVLNRPIARKHFWAGQVNLNMAWVISKASYRFD